MSAIVKTFDVDGVSVKIVNFRGREAMVAADLGAWLGYEADGFRRSVNNWRDELVAGQDFAVLSGRDAAEFRSICGSAKMALSANARLFVLFESGWNLVLIKSEKPFAKKLRRFLASEVMPALRRGDMTRADDLAAELVRVSLRLAPAPASTPWDLEIWQLLCRLCRQPVWSGKGKMPRWLMRPIGRIYLTALGRDVYRALKARNPKPKGRSCHYHWLQSDRFAAFREADVVMIRAMLRMSVNETDFFARLGVAFGRTKLFQLPLRPTGTG